MEQFTPEVIRWIVTAMLVLIASIALHEFGHAWMANRLGDDTPRRQGRLTLNPLAHADPIGTFALPLAALIFTHGQSTGFGWGKPVEWIPRNSTRKVTLRTAQAMVAFAGPFMNLVLGIFVALVHVILIKTGAIGMDSPVHMALWYAVRLNFVLMLFNLLPAHPLDGASVLQRFVPLRHQSAFEKIQVYGPFILMAFIMISPLSRIFTWPAEQMTGGIYRAFTTIFGM
jgi:Zn-dependent protease